MKKAFVLVLLIGLLLAAIAPALVEAAPLAAGFSQPVKVIFDTDIAMDVDDVGALAVLHALQDNGEAQILAEVTDTRGTSGLWGAKCLDAINTAYGRPNILIGRSTSGLDDSVGYTVNCANNYPQDLGSNPPSALAVYRQTLAGQADNSVVIVSVGYLNNLSDLLQSPADGYSSLTGLQLVTAKVKGIVIMGGQYPSGSEWNFNRQGAATQYVLANWPSLMRFSGWEIGGNMITCGSSGGATIVQTTYQDYSGGCRYSWDLTAVLAAVRDPLSYWGMVTTGSNSANSSGANTWNSSPDKNHEYLTQTSSQKTNVTNVLQDLLNHVPSQGAPTPTPAPAALLLRYNFDNASGTSVSDASGNGNTGTLTGFTNTGAGVGSYNGNEGWVSGGGLNFRDDSTRSYVETNLALNSLANSDFTVEYKASYSGSSGWTPAIGTDDGSCCTLGNVFFGIADNLTGNEARLQGSAANIGSQPWGSSSSAQHHVALVFTNSSKVVELFVDGVSKGTSTFSSANMNQTSKFRIGNTGWDSGEQWAGVMYGIAISRGKLGPGSFVLSTSSPTPTPTPPPSALLLRYNFDNGSGTSVSDASGNGNTGTLTGFTNTGAGVGSYNGNEGWVSGGGLNFRDDSTRSYVETNLALNSLANSDFTVEYKASYSGSSGWTPAIGSNASSCCDATVFLGINTNLTGNEARLQGSAANIGSQPWGSSSSTPHRVALVFTNSSKVVELFVGGVSKGTSTFSSANMNQTSKFRIGNSGHDTTEQWAGVIYAIAISKSKLTPSTFVLQ